jgi:hypothetical protein
MEAIANAATVIFWSAVGLGTIFIISRYLRARNVRKQEEKLRRVL